MIVLIVLILGNILKYASGAGIGYLYIALAICACLGIYEYVVLNCFAKEEKQDDDSDLPK